MTARRILFVCVENSCRSQMAEGFVRASGRRDVIAWSAGSRPAGAVDPRAIRFMAEIGVELASHSSIGLDELPAGVTWETVVTMGCGDACPHLPARRRLDWDLEDPKDLDDDGFRAVRDDIGRRVAALLAELPGP